MRVLLLFAASLLFFSAYGQKLTLSARVLDNETQEPLTYASIGIKGKPIGTISNLNGEFDFHFPSEYRNELLVISMIGYENFEAPIWSLLENESRVILMSKSTTMLPEIVVTDSLTGGEILQIALSRVEQNFPMQPFMLDGFYRDVKKVGGTYISLLEAAVKIFDENYAEPRNKSKLRERVKLVEVRKSLGYDNKFTTYFGQRNLLEDLLLHNNIRYRQIDADDEFLNNIVREKDSFYNDQEIYVVSNTKDFFLQVYINKADYSILHLEFEISGDSQEKRRNLVSKFVSFKKSIDFKRYDGKMYLNYITVTSKERWYDASTDQFKFETELVQHLLINHVLPNPLSRIGTTEKMRNYGLQYQDYPYNKKFWDEYNVIKETPIDRKVLDDLEKIAPLEKQFENN
ncbi:carboxypeptidase-like regulatory domain-containing protein [Chryseolinea soli]|uniref:Carboxypeptidase-like regulatory domain-containing protein n=1 Tax=Chryseolinea soli TaxID=2321403 RepID=A0A385SNI3_9BACT|nr:carboxypeptidase-like regulatory domain-containing protein [Chryseolinea soli]AYB31020.1 carboxypeptidase-like regulatory domain-containing protein [Chryseolinea soli]